MRCHCLCKSSSKPNEILIKHSNTRSSQIIKGIIFLVYFAKGVVSWENLLWWDKLASQTIVRKSEIALITLKLKYPLSLLLLKSEQLSPVPFRLQIYKSLPDQMAKSQGNEVWKLGWKEFPEENLTVHCRIDRVGNSKRKAVIRKEKCQKQRVFASFFWRSKTLKQQLSAFFISWHI